MANHQRSANQNFTLVKMAITKKTQITNVGKDVTQREPSGTLLCMGAQELQLYPTLHSPMNCSLPGSSVHGILQARILEWVAMFSSRGSSQARHRACISQVFCIGRRVIYKQRHLGSPIHCWWKYKLVQPLWKAVWRILKNLKMELLYDPVIPLHGVYVGEENPTNSKGSMHPQSSQQHYLRFPWCEINLSIH